MFLKQHDWFLLKLFWFGLRNQSREMTLYNKVFLLCGGFICLLWPLSDLTDLLRFHAVQLCNTYWLWPASLAMFFVAGGGLGLHITGIALEYANVPYFRVQPVSEQTKRRMAAFASGAGNLLTAPAAAIVLTTICEIVHKPTPFLWGFGAALAYILGAGLGLTARLKSRAQNLDYIRNVEPRQFFHLPIHSKIRQIDRAYPAWLSSWSIGLIAGRLPFSFARTLSFLIVFLAAVLPSVASLADHRAAPAASGAVVTGFAAFMLVVRCRPLCSPVLRTAPIGFIKAWVGTLRLPLLLSTAFFVVPAGAAIAAEPSSWSMTVSGGLGLFVLDGVYAVFAAFFLMSPLLAATCFFGVVFYASYKWVTYHAVVYVCFTGMLALMGYRIRRNFYNGN